jgi:hypothetical protein
MISLSGSKTLISRCNTALCLIVATFSLNTSAQPAEEDLQSKANPWQWLEGEREKISRNVTALGQNLDAWLAGENISDSPNETYLRVRFNQQLASFAGYHSRIKIDGSLDLPQTSKRWKLIFESDSEELSSLEDNVLGDETSRESIGGLSYQHEVGKSWQVNHSIGLRSRVPADPFYRFKAQREHKLNEAWSLNFQQKLWNYKSQGWGYDTEVSFNRIINQGKILQISSEVKYQQNHNLTEFSQTIALHNSLAQFRTISYELGILGLNRPNIRINDYYIGAQYRRALRGDWLFLETAPQIIVARDENWRPEPRLLINLEMLFSDI